MTYRHRIPSSHQRGVTLIELLVGITIGLLTVAVGMGALVVSRSVSGTVSDASEIQQQAAYALRVIGRQLRQAGSLRLNLAAQKRADPTVDMADPVAFETTFTDSADSSTYDPTTNTVSGLNSPGTSEYKLTTGYRNYTEQLYSLPNPSGAAEQSLQRDCLGESGTNAMVQSRFVHNTTTNELHCAGTGQPQPIVRNVANFQVRYLMQSAAGTGSPQVQYVDAATVGTAPSNPNWAQVFGVEVCLVLYGNEAIDLPTGANYTDCDGTTNVDMSSAASTDMSGNAIGGQRARRMHMVFRNIYQLRSQGQTG